MKKFIIPVTEPEYTKAKAVFDALTTDTLSFEGAPANEDALVALIAERETIGVILGPSNYKGPLYDNLPAGSIIARFGVGVDGVDRERTRARGIYITNTPGVLDTSVAEHAIFLMGSLARNIPTHSEGMRNDEWSARPGVQLNGKTLAIVGFGHIAREVARIAAMGFGMSIQACDVVVTEEQEKFVSDLAGKAGVPVKLTRCFEDSVSEAHFISIHTPLLESTRGLIDSEKLALMPKGSFLINTSRGGIVDESALYDALSTGHLAGAAFDVFENEPYVPARAGKDLRTLKNLIMTPHVGSNTDMSNQGMAKACVANIRACIEGRYEDMTTVT